MYAECSIIIPVFNAENTIKGLLQCLEADSQFTYEIIVVDDGSTDRTSEVIKQYSSIRCGVKAIRKQNGGVSSARNRGLEEATGKWIYFADADDEVNLIDLDKMIAKGNELNVDVVVSNYQEKNTIKSEIKHISSCLTYNSYLDKNYIERTILYRLLVLF